MKLEVKKISKKFGNEFVLTECNCNFEDGKIYGLMGRNGSGKSVFLKILCGFYKPSSGSILLDGYDYILHNEFPKDTRALIEKPRFISDLSGLDNLKLLAAITQKISLEEIIKTLDLVGLSKYKDKKYSKYSLGMKQKLGIAQVLMEDPSIMIFDEPFNGVDEKSVKKLREILINEKKRGKIIIISSHIKEDIVQLADVIYKFEEGYVEKVN